MLEENKLPLLWCSIYNEIPKIIGIDPGENTGLVVFDTNKEEIIHHCTLKPKELFWLFQHLEEFDYHGAEQNFKDCKIHKVIIEEFRVYPWANLNFKELPVVKIIGVLEYLIPKEYLLFQKPSNKLFFKNPKMKRIGYDIKDFTDHEKDALKHILFYYHLVKHNTAKLMNLINGKKS